MVVYKYNYGKDNNMYKKSRHSCYDLKYHLVLVTKYRHPVIKNDLAIKLKEYTMYYFNNNKLDIIEFNDDLDHIHILFEGKPNLNLSNFVNGLKTLTSKNIRKDFSEELKPYYREPYFWSRSYFVSTVSEQSQAVVEQYIKNQKG
jgi:putative transposase